MGRLRDDWLLNMIETAGGLCHLDDLESLAIPVSAVQRLQRVGAVRRLAGAAFVTTRQWTAADRWTRFRLQSLAVGRCSRPGVHLAGWAAAAVHGLPLLGMPPKVPVCVIAGDPHRSPERSPYYRLRHGYLPEHRQVVCADVPVIDEAYTAVDVARHFGRPAGLMVADAVFARGTGGDDLLSVCDNMRRYPGIKDARWCTEHATARSESPVETLGRWAFLRQGRQAPLANVWLWRDGIRYRADLFLPEEGVVLEADGAIKYNNRPDAAQIIREQIVREENFRSWNLAVVRFTFTDAWQQPDFLVERADKASLMRLPLPLLCDWSLDPPWLR